MQRESGDGRFALPQGQFCIQGLQQRRLAGTDATDQIYHFARFHLERNIGQYQMIALEDGRQFHVYYGFPHGFLYFWRCFRRTAASMYPHLPPRSGCPPA